MGSLAALARELGHEVSGSDANVYPPMSTQLQQLGIELHEGYDADFLAAKPDLVIVGNAMSRGNPAVEALLEARIPYTSGPQWLHEQVLRDRHVLALAGTHGKTTTTSMLAFVLQEAGLEPGFLVGGVAQDFPVSARLGGGKYFVIEADEYDTAFFDKRSKFVHYHPQTLVLNNLEFDHADIFADLAAIQTQFHHLMRIVPASGRVIMPADAATLQEVMARGCWSEQETFLGESARWQVRDVADDWQQFTVIDTLSQQEARLCWQQTGEHNLRNALAVIAAADHVGVALADSCAALARFKGVKRRMELRGEIAGVAVYDDFAHHPTAIASTIEGLRRASPEGRLIAVIEPRSNTMRMGVHQDALKNAVNGADRVVWYHAPSLTWDPAELISGTVNNSVCRSVDDIIAAILGDRRPGDKVLIMSNGGFEGIHERLLTALQNTGI
jgi:UDP-N-acetylmuramate: L-alanyl-gamma-D-glutamyl-meso-diaminopimelate ligase